MFNKGVEIDLQEERQGNYKTEKCGSSSESNCSKGIHWDERTGGNGPPENNNELESSCDSVDGFIKVRAESREVNGHNMQNFIHSVSDIGPETKNTRATNIINDHGSNDPAQPQSSSTTDDNNSSDVTLTNDHIEDQKSQHESQPLHRDGLSTDELEHTGQTKAGGTKLNFDNNKDKLLPKLPRSPKRYHAPSLPQSKRSTEKPPKTATPAFADADLTAFALECVQHASKKTKSLERNDRESKSDSDEDNKILNLDYVYIPKKTLNHQVIKSSTHPQSAFDEGLARGAFSDDDSYTNKVRQKRSSADSLDGFVLFDAPKDVDFENYENKSHSSNENESTKDSLKVDYAGSGLRKFPSMPLFYVPKDGNDAKNSKSLGKSLWKRLKSLPRSTENHRTSPHQKTKQSQSTVRADPFYHGEKDEEEDQKMAPETRPKSHSVESRKSSRRRRRMSLDPKLTAPSSVTEPPEEKKQNENVANNTAKLPSESQC
ncbi:hypothetical protein QZH41_003602 [Actinostola sp. cb2023]|nr:hypothetical protein QZH41_003602 [Actinostola sp. cb2023]